MASAVDIYMLEKKIGKEAADKLRDAFKQAIRDTINAKGPSLDATVTAKYKSERLDRLTFSAPHYIFKQHYGFEGTKKNGVNMRLAATNVLNIALAKSGVLDSLADNISNLRAEQVVTGINFIRRGQ